MAYGNITNKHRIVFVDTITDSEALTLSKKFPYAVFLTSDNNNIYKGGARYTKFQGVSDEVLTLGEHKIKLEFDINTGIVSLRKALNLTSLTLSGLYKLPLNYTVPSSSTISNIINNPNNQIETDIERYTYNFDPTFIPLLSSPSNAYIAEYTLVFESEVNLENDQISFIFTNGYEATTNIRNLGYICSKTIDNITWTSYYLFEYGTNNVLEIDNSNCLNNIICTASSKFDFSKSHRTEMNLKLNCTNIKIVDVDNNEIGDQIALENNTSYIFKYNVSPSILRNLITTPDKISWKFNEDIMPDSLPGIDNITKLSDGSISFETGTLEFSYNLSVMFNNGTVSEPSYIVSKPCTINCESSNKYFIYIGSTNPQSVPDDILENRNITNTIIQYTEGWFNVDDTLDYTNPYSPLFGYVDNRGYEQYVEFSNETNTYYIALPASLRLTIGSHIFTPVGLDSEPINDLDKFTNFGQLTSSNVTYNVYKLENTNASTRYFSGIIYNKL